jgi:hypothetical protein
MAISVSPSALLRNCSSTAQARDGASAASAEPAASVPSSAPEPLGNFRRTSGRSSFGTSPLSLS